MDRVLRYGVRAVTVLTPSPVRPRLVKAPVAVHPLPQGGEGKVCARAAVATPSVGSRRKAVRTPKRHSADSFLGSAVLTSPRKSRRPQRRRSALRLAGGRRL